MRNGARKVSRHKRRGAKENRRIEHKSLRQVERQALDGGHLRPPRTMGWRASVTEKDAPLINDVMPHRSKRKGCKRNKGGKHSIVTWPSLPSRELWYDPERERWTYRAIPWVRRRWHPPYKCERCGKGFYSIPKGHEKEAVIVTVRADDQYKQDDHYDLFNIRMRLCGLRCR